MDPTTPATGMAVIMEVVSSLFGVMGDVVDEVTANAPLAIGLAATIGGIGISWYMRLTHQKSGRRR